MGLAGGRLRVAGGAVFFHIRRSPHLHVGIGRLESSVSRTRCVASVAAALQRLGGGGLDFRRHALQIIPVAHLGVLQHRANKPMLLGAASRLGLPSFFLMMCYIWWV